MTAVVASIGGSLLTALSFAFGMFWEILWALILGFALSAAVQAVVSKREMRKLLPDDSPRSLLIASGLGAASSSCSYASVALAPRFADAIEVLTPHMLRRCGASMMRYEGLPNFIALTQMGHNQRENKTLIRYYSRAFDQAEEKTAVRAPVADQIARARALYSGKPLERALKLAASA